MEMINKKENIFGDGIAFVEQWDFSKANLNEENRILAITQVASICYQSPKAIGSESLYNRLMAESQGLPSSSFEFVPMLFEVSVLKSKFYDIGDFNIFKFGEKIDHNEKIYLLTNLRALVYDVENNRLDKSWLNLFNTEEECNIIKEHFKVFLYKVDLPTRSQMVRHRVNLQELSRRYVSGKRVHFDFYVSKKMKNITTTIGYSDISCGITAGTRDVIDICLEHYYKALEQGIKPQEARRIIPQAAYTQIWGGFQPTQLENFMKLRDDEVHAQWEIAQVAKAMREMLNDY